MRQIKLIIATLFLISPFAANADVITVGPTDAGADCTFACMETLQQAYDSSYFSGPIEISQVNFFQTVANRTYNGTWELRFGYMNGDYTTMQSGSDAALAANRGSALSLFDSVTVDTVLTTGDVFSFNGSFLYDPSLGDLLVEIFQTGAADGVSNFGGMAAAAGLLLARSYHWDPDIQPGYAGDVGYGISTQFVSRSVPEPATLALLGLGLAGLGLRRKKA